MADQNAGGGKFIDDLVTKAKDVGEHVREFAEDAFDHAKDFASGAGENIKEFATHAGGNIKDLAGSAGENIKDLAGTAREKGQQAFDGIKQKLGGDTVQGQLADVKDATADTVQTVKGAVGDAVHAVKDAVVDAVDTAKEVADIVYGGSSKGPDGGEKPAPDQD